MRRRLDWFDDGAVRPSHSVCVGVSKAQAGLAKIIAIISTLPPPRIERGCCNSEAACEGGRGLGLGLDLNLRLGPPPEIGGGPLGNEDDEGGGTTAQSGVVVEPGEELDKGSRRAPHAGEESSAISPTERSSEGECDLEEGGEDQSRKEAKESSGITTAPSRKADDGDEDEEVVVEVIKKLEENQEEKVTKGDDGSGREEAGWDRRKFDGSLDLLLAAVRQVSGGLLEEEPGREKAAEEERVPETRAAGVAQGSKRRGAGWLPFHPCDDSAPIVRSKRGRSQALPSRFRDSILDPWRKLPTVPRHGRAARP